MILWFRSIVWKESIVQIMLNCFIFFKTTTIHKCSCSGNFIFKEKDLLFLASEKCTSCSKKITNNFFSSCSHPKHIKKKTLIIPYTAELHIKWISMSALTLLTESFFLSKCLNFTSHILPAFNTSVLMSVKEVKNNWILKKLNSPHFKKTQVTLPPLTLGNSSVFLKGD